MTGTPLVIIGPGGFGLDVRIVIEAIGDVFICRNGLAEFKVLGFLDDTSLDAVSISDRGLAMLYPAQDLEGLPGDVQHVIAIGNGEVGQKLHRVGLWAGRAFAGTNARKCRHRRAFAHDGARCGRVRPGDRDHERSPRATCVRQPRCHRRPRCRPTGLRDRQPERVHIRRSPHRRVGEPGNLFQCPSRASSGLAPLSA